MLSHLGRLLEAGEVLVLTGAGVSTDSGIPDYRGTPGVVRQAPISYRQFIDDVSARRRYWARSHLGWRNITGAEPNSGHRAIADLERAGLAGGVITQNVDGLHQAAGSQLVLELHGSLAGTVCLGCGDRRARLELHHRLAAANPGFDAHEVRYRPDGDALVPDDLIGSFQTVACLECGGLLKPDVVFFGENVAKPVVASAYEWLAGASALMVVGSSLAVMSGYRFVLAARREGKPIAIVNRGPTRGDADATVKIHGEIASTLVPLIGSLAGSARR